MQQQISDDGKKDTDDAPSSGWASYFLWLVTFAAAIVVERLTKSVALAAIMPCYHASWKTLRCAFWLKRSDPISARGWACFFFYAATACWKAAGAALATGLLCSIAAERLNQKAPEDLLQACLMIMAYGGCFTAILGMCAILPARRGKVRVWVNPLMYEICRSDFYKLLGIQLYYQQLNQAIVALAVAVFLPIMVIGTLVILIATTNCAADEFTPLGWFGLLLLTVGPIAMIPFFGILSSRIIARSPAECWPFLINEPSA